MECGNKDWLKSIFITTLGIQKKNRNRNSIKRIHMIHLKLLHVQVQLHVIMVIVDICADIYSLNVNHATKCKLCNQM